MILLNYPPDLSNFPYLKKNPWKNSSKNTLPNSISYLKYVHYVNLPLSYVAHLFQNLSIQFTCNLDCIDSQAIYKYEQENVIMTLATGQTDVDNSFAMASSVL